MDSKYLFVYGTLLKDYDSPMAKFLLACASFVGKGYFYGQLYEVSWYPGAVLNPFSKDKVYGHVFELRDKEQTFRVLDAYEGIDPNMSSENEYRRESTTAFLDDGSQYKVWVYIYKRSTASLRLIPSGYFLNP